MDRVTRMIYPDNDRSVTTTTPAVCSNASAAVPAAHIISSINYLPSGPAAASRLRQRRPHHLRLRPRLRLKHALNRRPSARNRANPLRLRLRRRLQHRGHPRPASRFGGRSGATNARNTQTFTYDDLYRLTRVQYNLPTPSTSNGGEINYRYDRIGNMLAQTSDIAHIEKGLSVTDLGTMDYGGTAAGSTASAANRTTRPAPTRSLQSAIHNRHP